MTEEQRGVSGHKSRSYLCWLVPVSLVFHTELWFISLIAGAVSTEKPLWLWDLTLYLTPELDALSSTRISTISASVVNISGWTLEFGTAQQTSSPSLTFPLGVTHLALFQHQGQLRLCKVATVVLWRVEGFPAYLWTAWFIEVVVDVTAQTEWISSSCAVGFGAVLCRSC